MALESVIKHVDLSPPPWILQEPPPSPKKHYKLQLILSISPLYINKHHTTRIVHNILLLYRTTLYLTLPVHYNCCWVLVFRHTAPVLLLHSLQQWLPLQFSSCITYYCLLVSFLQFFILVYCTTRPPPPLPILFSLLAHIIVEDLVYLALPWLAWLTSSFDYSYTQYNSHTHITITYYHYHCCYRLLIILLLLRAQQSKY